MKYGFLGCGNMGGALAKALSKTTKEIILADKFADKAKELAKELGITFGTNEDVVTKCDAVFLAVKPQMLAELLDSVREDIQKKRPLIISMAAGTEVAFIENKLDPEGKYELPIIRIMPNTPVSVGKGMILYCANRNVSKEQKDTFIEAMREAGEFDEIPENLIDAGSAVSGCGPAYMYLFIEALADGGVACGLPRDKALKYAIKTMEGSACLLDVSGKHPGELKDAVCSPGGTTIMGVKALEDGGLRSAGMQAVIAAYEKTKKL